MGDFAEYDTNINEMLDTFERELKNLDKKDAAQKTKSIQRNQTYLKQIEQFIQSYQLDVQGLDKSESSSYVESLKQISSRHKRLKGEFELKKNEQNGQDQLFGGSFNKKDEIEGQMTGEEMISKAKAIQDDGVHILTDLVQIIEQNNQLADEINLELESQITKLDNIYAEVKDTQTELKRTQKYLKYFFKQLYTDKILLFLICIVFTAIVFLIIVSKAGISF